MKVVCLLIYYETVVMHSHFHLKVQNTKIMHFTEWKHHEHYHFQVQSNRVIKFSLKFETTNNYFVENYLKFVRYLITI